MVFIYGLDNAIFHDEIYLETCTALLYTFTCNSQRDTCSTWFLLFFHFTHRCWAAKLILTSWSPTETHERKVAIYKQPRRSSCGFFLTVSALYCGIIQILDKGFLSSCVAVTTAEWHCAFKCNPNLRAVLTSICIAENLQPLFVLYNIFLLS